MNELANKFATASVLVDDEKVKVTRFDFEAGAQTGWHTHQMDYIVTPITMCNMLIKDANGDEKEVIIEAGAAYKRCVGVNHNVFNNGDETMSFVEVELK